MYDCKYWWLIQVLIIVLHNEELVILLHCNNHLQGSNLTVARSPLTTENVDGRLKTHSKVGDLFKKKIKKKKSIINK